MLSSPRSWNFNIDHHLNRIIPPSPLPHLPYVVAHWLGYRKTPPKDVGNILGAFFAFIGAFAGLLAVAGLFNYTSIKDLGGPILIASFGASAILEYNTLSSPLAQPRNTLIGHTLSATIGVGVTKLFALSSLPSSFNFLPASLACALSSAAMLLTNTIHPPGGASAVLAATLPDVVDMGWAFVGLVALGSVIMMVVGLFTNNLMRRFPVYWWTSEELGRRRGNEDAAQSVDRRSNEAWDSVLAVTSQGVQVPAWLELNVEEAVLLEGLREKLVGAQTAGRLSGASSAGCTAVQSRDDEKDSDVPGSLKDEQVEERKEEAWRMV